MNLVHGTPVMLTNTDGNAVWEATFAPFGEPVSLNEDPDGDGTAVTMNIRMPGQYFDAETGLNYNWHRFYDPAVGRYAQAETPINEVSAANGYRYADNSPLKAYDVTGENGCGGRNQCSALSAGESAWIQALKNLVPNPCDPVPNPCSVEPILQLCPDLGHPAEHQGPSRRNRGLCYINLDTHTYTSGGRRNAVYLACGIDHEYCELSGMSDCDSYNHQIDCIEKNLKPVPIDVECRRDYACDPLKPLPPYCPKTSDITGPSTGR